MALKASSYGAIKENELKIYERNKIG